MSCTNCQDKSVLAEDALASQAKIFDKSCCFTEADAGLNLFSGLLRIEGAITDATESYNELALDAGEAAAAAAASALAAATDADTASAAAVTASAAADGAAQSEIDAATAAGVATAAAVAAEAAAASIDTTASGVLHFRIPATAVIDDDIIYIVFGFTAFEYLVTGFGFAAVAAIGGVGRTLDIELYNHTTPVQLGNTITYQTGTQNDTYSDFTNGIGTLPAGNSYGVKLTYNGDNITTDVIDIYINVKWDQTP